jgi:hypothetical protein
MAAEAESSALRRRGGGIYPAARAEVRQRRKPATSRGKALMAEKGEEGEEEDGDLGEGRRIPFPGLFITPPGR